MGEGMAKDVQPPSYFFYNAEGYAKSETLRRRVKEIVRLRRIAALGGE